MRRLISRCVNENIVHNKRWADLYPNKSVSFNSSLFDLVPIWLDCLVGRIWSGPAVGGKCRGVGGGG